MIQQPARGNRHAGRASATSGVLSCFAHQALASPSPVVVEKKLRKEDLPVPPLALFLEEDKQKQMMVAEARDKSRDWLDEIDKVILRRVSDRSYSEKNTPQQGEGSRVIKVRRVKKRKLVDYTKRRANQACLHVPREARTVQKLRKLGFCASATAMAGSSHPTNDLEEVGFAEHQAEQSDDEMVVFSVRRRGHPMKKTKSSRNRELAESRHNYDVVYNRETGKHDVVAKPVEAPVHTKAVRRSSITVTLPATVENDSPRSVMETDLLTNTEQDVRKSESHSPPRDEREEAPRNYEEEATAQMRQKLSPPLSSGDDYDVEKESSNRKARPSPQPQSKKGKKKKARKKTDTKNSLLALQSAMKLLEPKHTRMPRRSSMPTSTTTPVNEQTSSPTTRPRPVKQSRRSSLPTGGSCQDNVGPHLPPSSPIKRRLSATIRSKASLFASPNNVQEQKPVYTPSSPRRQSRRVSLSNAAPQSTTKTISSSGRRMSMPTSGGEPTIDGGTRVVVGTRISAMIERLGFK